MLGVDVRLELSVLITSFMGKNSRYIFAFSNPMGRSCNCHVYKPWLNQTNSDIPTPEYNVFSGEMFLWAHWLWKSTFWQEIYHRLKLHKIQIAKRKIKNNRGFEPITRHVWDKQFYSSDGQVVFLGVRRPTLRLIRLKINEIILTGRITQIKKRKKKKKKDCKKLPWQE